jgi:hypothetical protein
MLALAALITGGPARAGTTATRCNADGCAYLHCNSTGDRCYRFEDEYHAPWSAAGRSRSYGPAGGPERGSGRLVCDPDGDRCFRSPDSRWDFREYYRRLGYRWNDEDR